MVTIYITINVEKPQKRQKLKSRKTVKTVKTVKTAKKLNKTVSKTVNKTVNKTARTQILSRHVTTKAYQAVLAGLDGFRHVRPYLCRKPAQPA